MDQRGWVRVYPAASLSNDVCGYTEGCGIGLLLHYAARAPKLIVDHSVGVHKVSRTILDNDLMVWEVFASGGPFGLPEMPKIVFHCSSDLDRRARFVRHEGDNSTAQNAVREMSDAELRELLKESIELD